jgi:molybdenum-dependent DNA-binding transcriptional regulator ModE
MTTHDDKPTKELTATDAKPVRERRVSKRVAEVVRLIVVGECKTVKAAAERAGMNYTHVCETLKKPHVQVFIDRRVRETIANGTMRATARLIELMDSASDHVSLDAVKHELALNGHKPTADPVAQVNINIRAGYVIDLSDDPPAAKVINMTPTPPREGCKDGR